jgi:hypothetical protein
MPLAVDGVELDSLPGLPADERAAEQQLWQSQQRAPTQVGSYVPLYKFYFHRRRFGDAERAARTALTEAAAAGGFAGQWQELVADAVDWTQPDGPARLCLFSLKALAFTRLRQGERREAAAILAKLAEIDPRDQVGADVIRALLAAVSADSPAASSGIRPDSP